jgi:hypothetical protein
MCKGREVDQDRRGSANADISKHHLEGILVIKRLTGIFGTRLVNAYEEATGP